jgi:hypothetical protein
MIISALNQCMHRGRGNQAMALASWEDGVTLLNQPWWQKVAFQWWIGQS